MSFLKKNVKVCCMCWHREMLSRLTYLAFLKGFVSVSTLWQSEVKLFLFLANMTSWIFCLINFTKGAKKKKRARARDRLLVGRWLQVMAARIHVIYQEPVLHTFPKMNFIIINWEKKMHVVINKQMSIGKNRTSACVLIGKIINFRFCFTLAHNTLPKHWLRPKCFTSC